MRANGGLSIVFWGSGGNECRETPLPDGSLDQLHGLRTAGVLGVSVVVHKRQNALGAVLDPDVRAVDALRFLDEGNLPGMIHGQVVALGAGVVEQDHQSRLEYVKRLVALQLLSSFLVLGALSVEGNAERDSNDRHGDCDSCQYSYCEPTGVGDAHNSSPFYGDNERYILIIIQLCLKSKFFMDFSCRLAVSVAKRLPLFQG